MRRHRFVTSWVLEVPDVGTDNVVARAALNGWQVTGILQYQSGQPYTITTGNDISRDGIGGDRGKTTGVSMDPPDGSDQTVWFNPAAFAAADVGTFGTVGRGAYFGPSTYYFDMGLSKNVRFSNDMSMQFRAEFFNIFNQVNFANPNTAPEQRRVVWTHHRHAREPG